MKFLTVLLCLPLLYSPKARNVQISVKELNEGHVVFQPVLVPMFWGDVDGDMKDKISMCQATTEEVAKIEGGGDVVAMVLYCGKDHKTKITVRGIQFED
jgi:hypothetical protein